MAKKQPKLSKTPVCQKAISNNLFLSLRTNCNSSNSYISNNKPKFRTVFFLIFFYRNDYFYSLIVDKFVSEHIPGFTFHDVTFWSLVWEWNSGKLMRNSQLLVWNLNSLQFNKNIFPFTKSEPRSIHKIGMAPSIRGILTKKKNQTNITVALIIQQ
jgi:hypothetical protein